MALLSTSQLTKIRSAIKDVTDQFMVTPITYHISGETFDRYNEDQDEQKFYSIRLNGLVEHYQEDDIVQTLQGNKDKSEITVTFNLEDLDTLKLITSDYKVKFNQTRDYFTVKAQLYKVTDIYYDGPLDEKDILVVIKGEISKNTNLDFNTFIGNGLSIPVDEIIASKLDDRFEDIETGTDELDRWNEGNNPTW